MQQFANVYDNKLLLKAAGLIAASAAVATIIDLGAGGRVDGTVIVDTTAVEIDTGNEMYTILVQVSDTADFTTGSPKIKNVSALRIGHSSVTLNDASEGAIGRYELPFTNEFNGVAYRYLRLYTLVVGTIATGINYKAYAAYSHGG